MRLTNYLPWLVMIRPSWADSQPTASDIVAALASAPPCAVACFTPALKASGCAMTDAVCICQSDKIKAALAACLTKQCTMKQALSTLNSTTTACKLPIRSRTTEYIRVSNTFGIITAAFVAQRFVFKIWANLEIGFDDWFALITTLIGVPVTVINAHGVTANGLGRDIWTLSYENITSFIFYFFLLEVLYFAAVSTLKLSLLFFYKRIFPSPTVQKLLYGTIVFDCLLGIAFTLVAIFQCAPINYYWDRWDGEHTGQCMNINVIAWSNAGISIGLDLWVLAIPLWQLYGLELDLRKKISVALMFCVGTFVTVVSILRLKSLVNFGVETLNPTWEFFDVGIWSTVEINVGIICVCLPTFRLMLVRFFPFLRGTLKRTYASATGRSSSRRPRKSSHFPLGSPSVSRVDASVTPSPGPPEGKSMGIMYQRSYEVDVEHSDAHWVHLQDMYKGQAKKDWEAV